MKIKFLVSFLLRLILIINMILHLVQYQKLFRKVLISKKAIIIIEFSILQLNLNNVIIFMI